ncbi:MAG: hypothetical protein AAF573_02420 [Bacteroidota bacterium]
MFRSYLPFEYSIYGGKSKIIWCEKCSRIICEQGPSKTFDFYCSVIWMKPLDIKCKTVSNIQCDLRVNGIKTGSYVCCINDFKIEIPSYNT